MKKLSDYKDEQAIELWADLLDPLVEIFKDQRIIDAFRSGKPTIVLAQEMIKSHANEVSKMLLIVDPTPLNGLNILIRLVGVLNELMEDPTLSDFFGLSAVAKKQETSFGSATENTGDSQSISSNTL
jgi:hypothetical protein